MAEIAGNTALSVLVALLVALTSTLASQFAKTALTLDESLFFAPYSMTYFNTLFLIPLYPFYVILKVFGTNDTIPNVHDGPSKILKDDLGKMRSKTSIILAGIIILIGWIAPNYIFAISLKYISVSAAVSINSLNAALVFILSVTWLKAEFSWFKASGVILSICGVVLMSMDNEFTGSLTGVILILFCALCIAIYNTTFKQVFGDLTFGQVLFFLTLLGLANLVLNTVPTVILINMDIDHIVWQAVPWSAIAANALLATLFNLSVNFGIAILNPLVVSIGILMGIPISTAVDIIFRNLVAGPTMIFGGILISAGFFLNTLPVDIWFKTYFLSYFNIFT